MKTRTFSAQRMLTVHQRHGPGAGARRALRVLWPGVVALAALVAAACAAGPAAPSEPYARAPAQPAAAPAAKAAQPAEAKPAMPAQPAPAKPAEPAQVAKPAAEKPAEPAASGFGQRLFVGTTNTTSSYYTYHVAETKYLGSRVPDVNLTVVETGGADDNQRRYSKGELHVGLMSGGVAYQGHSGVGQYKDKALPDLRYLWIYTVGARVVIVAEQSGVTKLDDLTAKPFNPGLARGATEKDFKAHAEILGIKPNYYTAGLDDAVQAMKDRRIMGMVKSQPGVTIDASTMDLMTFAKIRAVGYSDEEIKKIQQVRPWDQFLTVKKDEWVKGMPEFKTLATIVGTGTTKNFPEDLAYRFTKAMMEPAAVEEIGASASFIKGWDYRRRTLELAPIPLHKGVLKYFREVGDQVPEHLIPPEAK